MPTAPTLPPTAPARRASRRLPLRVGLPGRRPLLENARKPSWASALTRWRAMTRAVCHFDDAVAAGRGPRGRSPSRPAPPSGRTASTSATAASTAASSAASPSTTSWTSPIRWARMASNRRPPGNSARACDSPILAITNGEITAGRIPRRVSVNPNSRPGLGDDEVGDRAQTHPAAERRALDPGDRPGPGRCRSSRTSRPSPSRPARCPRRRGPSRRASSRCRRRRRTTGRRRRGRRPAARSATRAASAGERRPELGDQRGVERVVDLGPGERDAGDGVVRSGPLDPEQSRSRGLARRVPQVPPPPDLVAVPSPRDSPRTPTRRWPWT